MSAITSLSESIAAKVDKSIVGFDPASILALITGIITAIANCRKTEPVTEEDAKEAFAAAYSGNPSRTTRRVRHQVFVSTRRKEKRRLKDAELDELTDATIAGLLAADDEEIAACCTEVA